MGINQIKSKTITVVGYIGVALVFLSTAAYSIQVTIEPVSASVMLTITFFVINLLGWSIGYYTRQHPRTESLGRTLQILGDVIFPLNLYAPFFLYFFLLKGQISHSASAVLFIGIVYHLAGYLRPERRRFPLNFYPYFFAGATGTILYLTRFTIDLSPGIAVWLLVGFAIAFHIISVFANLQPGKHFSCAALVLAVAIVAVTAVAFQTEQRAGYLFALLVLTLLLFRQSWAARDLGPACRYFGFASFSSFTTFFTACLYYFGSPLALYVIVTAAWVCALTMFGIFLKDYRFHPFRESSHWLSVILGLSLIIYWKNFWFDLADIHFEFPFNNVMSLPFSFQLEQQVAALIPISIFIVGVAFLISSYWRRRHPIIAPSKAAFIIDTAIITLTSYLPLLIFVVAGTGVWLVFFREAYGAAIIPLIFSILYLFISRQKQLLYPMITLKAAGYTTIALSAFTSLYSVDLAIAISFISSFVFLWQSVREQSRWLQICFLFTITAAGALVTTRLPVHKGMLVLGLLSVGLVVVYRWLLYGAKMYVEARLTLVWALVLGVAAAIAEAFWGHFSPALFFSLWIGFLIALWSKKDQSAWQSDRDSVDRAIMQKFRRLGMAGYWIAHLAGAACIISMLQASEASAVYTALALSVWAWAHFGVCNLPEFRRSNRFEIHITQQVVHGFALLSLFFAAQYQADGINVFAAFLTASLYVVLRVVRANRLLEDMAALALIEAFYLLGIMANISLPEYYLSLIGIYLCFVLYRKAAKPLPVRNPVKRTSPAAGWFKQGLRFIWKNLLPISIMFILIIYPFWAFVHSLRNDHIYYLGAATIGLTYLFLISRQQAILVYIACLIFVQGSVYLLIFGEPGQRVNLFLVLVGTLIIVNQIFISSQTEAVSNSRKLSVN